MSERRIQQTSIDSYHTLTDKQTKQQRVYQIIKANPNLTDRELTFIMGSKDPNNVRPRRKELVDLGFVEASGKRVCVVSKKTALTWRVTQRKRSQ